MTPNWPNAREGLIAIRRSLACTDFAAALDFWDAVDYAIHGLFKHFDGGEMITDVRSEVDQLERALKDKNLPLANTLVRSVLQKVEVLAG